IVTLTFVDPDSGRIRTKRIPAEEIPVVKYDGECSSATFKACSKWLAEERNFTALRDEFGVEITLHSSNIYALGQDEKPNKALDGDFIGGQLPTGNGTPGGDFFDWFQVTAQPQPTYPSTQQSRGLF